MRHITANLLIVLSLISASSIGFAKSSGGGFLLEVNFFPTLSAQNDLENIDGGTPETNEYKVKNSTGFDTRNSFSYVFNNGMLLGLTYNNYSLTQSRALSATNEKSKETDELTAYGPSLGYASGNWRFVYTHFMSGVREYRDYQINSSGTVTFDSTYKHSDMTGYQLLIGYSFPISSWLELGTALVHQNLVFKKMERIDPVGGNGFAEKTMPSGQRLKMSSWDPMISLLFRF